MDQKHPLAAFTTLHERIFLYKPLEASDPRPSTSSQEASIPDLVVVCAWAFAQPRRKYSLRVPGFTFELPMANSPSPAFPDIAKYLVHYQMLYPHARILLLFNTVHNMLWRPDWMQMEDLQPAVWAIEDFLDSYNSKVEGKPSIVNEADTSTGVDGKRKREPTVVFHIFSNGGAHMAVQLAQAYRENIRMSSPPPSQSKTTNKRLPVSAVIFDSCPGHARYSTAGKTTLSFLPKDAHIARALGMPIAYAILGVAFLCHVSGIAEHVVIKLWRELNNPEGPFLLKSSTNDAEITEPPTSPKTVIPRLYLCGDADDMIPTQDVMEHAAMARQTTGLSDADANDVVRLEEFFGSMHVNHVSLHKERYWDAVRETLERIV